MLSRRNIRVKVMQTLYSIESMNKDTRPGEPLQILKKNLENAQQLRDRVASSFSDVSIVPLQMKTATFYRVQVGKFSDRAVAEEQAKQLTQSGFPVMILER